ncbi:Bug family tripartite tricarboxylate transporter substrate binding protein [Alicycliphilus denitrificans]|uniref:Tripartite tricarboxylate transporter substrate binding protein n=1 Tax=Alicycliphilus denitrificans (strain DSM 14773 / CIP 107495 / K601) TaxID=596154 RepID=F4G7G6_ALIDK|nr:tripartite tricarboxylate transporter substrate binding protein [Alicycliphilus denitrificans]AEB85496.1 hypothetical protein Alide2_3155 [Alicycliphilus denitrificans K601]
MCPRRISLACALLAAAASGAAFAQASAAFPCKIVKFVVPYPPGGSSDLLARMLVPGMNKLLDTTVVVENKAGAVGNIGTAQVSAAESDGCTWLLGNSSNIVVSRNLYKLTHDPVEYLKPVAEAAAVPMVLYVNANLPVKTFDEFIALLRKNPGKYSYASPGSGSTHQLLTEMMKIEFGLQAEHIPYKGSGPAIQDVIAGHVAFAFEGTSAIAPHVAGGKVKALATTGAARSNVLSTVPTMKELGHPKFVATNWYGVFVPAKTPDALVARLNAGLRQVVKSPEIVESLRKLDSRASDLDVAGFARFARFVQEEIPFWKSLADQTGVKVD